MARVVQLRVRVDDVLKGRLIKGSIIQITVSERYGEGPLLILGHVSRIRGVLGLDVYKDFHVLKDLTDTPTRDACVSLFRKYISNERIKHKAEREAAMTEWVVQCIEEETTRFAGINELAEGPWTVITVSERGNLTREQCERLFAALRQIPPTAAGRDYLVDQASLRCNDHRAPN